MEKEREEREEKRKIYIREEIKLILAEYVKRMCEIMIERERQ